MSSLIDVEKDIELLSRCIAENKKEIEAQLEENKHLRVSLKLLRRKRRALRRKIS